MAAASLADRRDFCRAEPIQHFWSDQLGATVWFRSETSHPPERPEALLTVPEACAALRVSRWTLYQLIRQRRLRTIKIGSRRCIPVASIQALIDRLQAEEGGS